ncbi:hypothetical protein BH23GEM9_BH23GEM9_31040 [soil metagenome]
MGGGSDRRRARAGGLLLVVQLVGFVIFPLVHAEPRDASLDHFEAPGSHPGGHNDAACHACRAIDSRVLASAGGLAGVPRPGTIGEGGDVVPEAAFVPRHFLIALAPRAPPSA